MVNYDRKHIYSTGVIYDRHLRSSKYVYNTGHCTVDLFFLTSLDQLLFVQKKIFSFFTKQPILITWSTVLSLPLQ
jgi:hypothetical protein